jgi:hypothetical protein
MVSQFAFKCNLYRYTEYVSAMPVDIMKRMMPKQWWGPCTS